MVMKRFYIVIIALLSFFTITIVKADSLPAFNLSTTDIPYFDDQFSSDYTLHEFLDKVIALESSNYDLILTPLYKTNPGSLVRVKAILIPKSIGLAPLGNLSYNEYSNNSYFALNLNYDFSSFKQYTFQFLSTSPLSSYDVYDKFENCYLNNICTNYESYTYSAGIYSSRFTSGPYDPNTSYDNELYTYIYPYYSSLPLNISFDSSYTSKFSTFSINNTIISSGGSIPTYYDLYESQPDPDYHIRLELDNITNILVGNITDLYNFRLNTRFFYDNYDYINDMSATFRIYGRKSNLDSNDNFLYYSYEDITSSCSAINGHKLDKTIDTSINYAQFFYFSQGIACDSRLDLTQYDNFYLDIQTFATSGNYFISYLEYSSTNGNVYFPNTSAYSIYDSFTNLPSDFSLLVTTNYSQRQVNVVSDNKYVLGCVVNLYNLSSNGACPTPSTIGSLSNLGYMIYKYPEDTSNSVDLSILTSFDSIISYGSNGTGENSSYTYYDESGTITNSVINNTITLNYNTDEYDVSDYFGIVNDYINSLSSDITNFSSLVQNFYDSAPQFVQLFSYIVFIIMCAYFVYLIIRK